MASSKRSVNDGMHYVVRFKGTDGKKYSGKCTELELAKFKTKNASVEVFEKNRSKPTKFNTDHIIWWREKDLRPNSVT